MHRLPPPPTLSGAFEATKGSNHRSVVTRPNGLHSRRRQGLGPNERVATAGASASSQSAAIADAAVDQEQHYRQQEEYLSVPMKGRRGVDGSLVYRSLPREEVIMLPGAPQPIRPLDPDLILRDVHIIQDRRAASEDGASLQVPGVRITKDPDELVIIGDGLPIIRGAEFPDAYLEAINQLEIGHAVPLPQPHPKFSLEDLARIARDGPKFSDLVLEHAETLPAKSETDLIEIANKHGEFEAQEASLPRAQFYRYVPSSVIGDWEYEVEPKWQSMEDMSVLTFYQGLRERNWTDKKRFKGTKVESNKPWRLQFFRCAYSEDPTAWTGLRAVITELPAEVGARGEAAMRRQWWVDMPEPGPPTPLEGDAEAALGDIGYRMVLSQIYQAYSQRLPKDAKRHLEKYGFVPPVMIGGERYSCPGENLLDVSFHLAPAEHRHGLVNWLLKPQLHTAWDWVAEFQARSGLIEFKDARERLMLKLFPPSNDLSFSWVNDNALSIGPLYFAVIISLGILVPAFRRANIVDIKVLEQDMGAAMEFAKSKSSARKEGLTGVSFADVAGLGPILGEVVEVVEFLKNPTAFSKLGARPPKGILFGGDPGTGKTLMAKALAGEAMVPFYQMSGTEFTEGIVGVGASRVRDLFKRARANAPCVIFVDEIDALGSKRAEASVTGGGQKVNEEREQTLNQLLTEMDGFTPDTGVVFIAATNRPQMLDAALVRPGRFDRRITMPFPDAEGRYDILKIHLRGKLVDPEVDLMQVARDLPGLTGADLANVVNEAQLYMIRQGRQSISPRDMYAGIDRYSRGELRVPLTNSYKMPLLAYGSREMGIAIVSEVLRKKYGRTEPVERISIQPRPTSVGRTDYARRADDDYFIMTRGKLLDRIRVTVAGGLAVRVLLGEETNFTMPDVKAATFLANQFVFNYCFSDLGIPNFGRQSYHESTRTAVGRARKVITSEGLDRKATMSTRREDLRFDPISPSDITWLRYTDEVRRIVKSCYEEVWTIVEEHKEAIWAGTKILADQRDMLAEELQEVMENHPPRTLKEDERPKLEDMEIVTRHVKDYWPADKIPWLQDAYPIPWSIKQERERLAKEEEREKAEASGVGAGFL